MQGTAQSTSPNHMMVLLRKILLSMLVKFPLWSRYYTFIRLHSSSCYSLLKISPNPKKCKTAWCARHACTSLPRREEHFYPLNVSYSFLFCAPFYCSIPPHVSLSLSYIISLFVQHLYYTLYSFLPLFTFICSPLPSPITHMLKDHQNNTHI